MTALDLHVQKVESVSLNRRPGRAFATAHADMSLWRIGKVDWSRPLEAKVRQRRYFRIGTTTDSTPLDDGSYGESGSVWISGWTHNENQEPGMSAETIKQMVRKSPAYVEYSPRWSHGWLSIQHPDATNWFLDVVRAGEKYTLRLGLRMTRESEKWSMQESRAERAKAFASGHPLFFDIPYVEFIRK